MEAVAIEVRTACKGCGQVVPLNAFGGSTTCTACRRTVELDAEQWHALIARKLASTPHEAATCPRCKGALPDEAAQFAPRGWMMCPACGTRLAIRVAPPALGWAGASFIVGEDATPPAATAGAAAPVMFACLACRAGIRADGSDRFPKCGQCGVENHLPDEVWLRLHPSAPVARWYLCLGKQPAVAVAPVAPVAPMAVAAAAVAALPIVVMGGNQISNRDVANLFGASSSSSSDDDDDDDDDKDDKLDWSSVDSYAIDPEHRIYCGGDMGYNDAVWCMDRNLNVLWSRSDLGISDIQVTYDANARRILAWNRSKHSLIVLNAADGSTVGNLGGQEPNHATVHGLDMDPCQLLVADLDGSMIALMDDRLVRYDPQGNGVPTWPPHGGLFGGGKEKLMPLFEIREGGRRHLREVESVYVETVGNHPTVLYSSAGISIGWDGRMYAESSEHIACFDRTGKRVYRIKVPLDSVDGVPKADAQGNLFVRGSRSGDPTLQMVLRVAPDGSRCDVLATDRTQGGCVGGEDYLLVAPDSTVYLLGSYKKLRVLNAVGNLQWQSPGSIEQDAKDDAEAARRA